MNSLPSPRLAFGDFVLDTAAPELRLRGQRVELQRKPMDLLVYLALNHDRVVPMAEVLERVWPDVVVSETAVRSALKAVRSALGDDGREQRMIRTRKRYGIQLVAPVQVVPTPVRASLGELPAATWAGRARWPDGFVERLALFLHRELAGPGELAGDPATLRTNGEPRTFLRAASRLAEALAEPRLHASGSH